MSDWFTNDRMFRSQLERGHHWAGRVCDRLVADGHDATLGDLLWRETLADRHAFADEQDILVHLGARCLRLEVKSRNFAFTDDPATFPYASAMVDTCEGWDAKTSPVCAVVMVSQRTGGMVVAPRSTQDQWRTRRTWDRHRNISVRNYECPRTLLRPYADLSAWLGQRVHA